MRILFIHNYPTRFVQLDIQLLQTHFLVNELYLGSRKFNPSVIWNYTRSHDLVFGWFASWHTFLPLLFARILNKPSLLVIGGYDLANMPDIGYGSQRGGIKKWVSRITMRLATQLVTNAFYSREEAERNAGIPPERVEVIYHGIPDSFAELPQKSDPPMVLTVGNVWEENLWRKGHEPFVRAAALLPDIPFLLVGAWKDNSIEKLKAIASPNVTFTGWVDDATLLDYYRTCHLYTQASAHEGFGMTVAEAMLAGCLPLVTHAGALPEVVGPHGVYFPSVKPAAMAEVIEQALQTNPSRSAIRQHVLENFSLSSRQTRLVELIESLPIT